MPQDLKGKCFLQTNAEITNFSEKQGFEKCVKLITGGTAEGPNLPKNICSEYFHYKITGRLRDLLEHAEVRTGKGLSSGTLSVDVVVAIRDSQLYISMPTQMYHACGLSGHKVKKLERYVAKFDMSHKFNPGEAQFDRLIWALENTLVEPIEFCLVSEKKLQLASNKLQISETHIQPESTTLHHIMIPDFSVPNSNIDQDTDQESLEDIYNWAGMVVIQSPLLNLDTQVDASLANYSLIDSVPEPKNSSSVTTYNFPGLLPPAKITCLWNEAQKYQWALLLVLGYEEAPVLGNNNLHGQGDYNTCVIFRQEYPTISMRFRSASDL